MQKYKFYLKNMVAAAIYLAGMAILISCETEEYDWDGNESVVINGVRWATCNVDEPGIFAASPESAGKFYRWNRKTAYPATGSVFYWEEYDSRDYSYIWETENNPCPAGWRIPTLEEIQRLLDTKKVSNEWQKRNGVYGRCFIDKSTGASIFLPAVGYRNGDDGMLGGVFNDKGRVGLYWTTTLPYYGSGNPYYLRFTYGDSKDDVGWECYFINGAYGLSLRCVEE